MDRGVEMGRMQQVPVTLSEEATGRGWAMVWEHICLEVLVRVDT